MTAFQSKLKKLNIVSQHSTKRGMALFSLIIILSMLLAMPSQVAQSAPQPAGTDGMEQVDAAYSYTNNVAYNIPDGTSATQNGCAYWPATRYFLVDDNFTVNDLNVEFSQSHANRGQLQMKLTAPDGTTKTLIATSGDMWNNYYITIDDSSTNALDDGNDDTIGGTRRLVGPSTNGDLDAFNGKNAKGHWTMTICDNTFNATGTSQLFNAATLVFDGTAVSPTPLNHTQGSPILETYFIPWPEDQVWTAMGRIFPTSCSSYNTFRDSYDAAPRQPMVGYTGITITDAGTAVTYDQWEDGYEADLTYPTQSSTQVWGDGDLLNGVAPGDPDDVLAAGQILVLNDVMLSTTLGTIVDFDARDKIGATKPIGVTRSVWADGSQTMFAAADEVYPTDRWGNQFYSPVGDNADLNQMFEVSMVSIIAAYDGTLVDIDKNGDGIYETTGVALSQGGTYLIDDNTTGMSRGGRIRSNTGHPIQVNLMTADNCAGYESRTYPLKPYEIWDSSYYLPVSTITTATGPGNDDAPTTVHIYNPNASSIYVAYDYDSGYAGYLTVAANSSSTLVVPVGEAVHFYNITAPPTTTTNDVEDQFNTADYNLNTGSVNWAGSWTEENDDGSPTAGDIRIESTLLRFRQGADQNDAIWRQANLSGYTSGTLSFTLDGNSIDGVNDAIAVQISYDGGTNYTTLQTFSTDPNGATQSYPLTSFTSTTRVRFLLTGNDLVDSNERWDIDNVNITFSYTTAATPGTNLFYGVASVDSDNASGSNDDQNTVYDWGMTMVPEDVMTQYVIVGWAPGDDPTFQGTATENTAPIWLTGGHPTGSTMPAGTFDICVDYNGDGGATQDPVSLRNYDRKVTGIAPLTQLKIYKNKVVPPDTGQGTAGDDQTGTQIWVCGPTSPGPGDLATDAIITAAWGGDPLVSSPSKPGLDMGYTVRNQRAWTATKGVSLLVDNNGDGLYDMGDTVRYSIVVKNTGGVAIPSGTLNVKDTPPAGVTYVLNSSTVKDHNNNTSAIPDGVSTPFPLDESGYTYGQGLPPGKSFTVSFDMTINTGFTAVTVLTNQAQVTDGEQTLLPEVSITVQYPPKPGVIGNYVWLDEDGDGDQDAGEAGIPNVLVRLCDDMFCNNGPMATTYTDANGGYLFTKTAAGADLEAGTYYVVVTPPAGMSQTYDEDGTLDNASRVLLNTGQEYMTADFGYNWNTTTETNNPPKGAFAAIGDRVWSDADGDGLQDAEELGLEGVIVNLYSDPDGDGVYDNLVASDTTDANGNYLFDNLTPGSYVVSISAPPAGYAQTGDPDQPGAICTTCDGKTTAPIVLSPGDVYVNADFGYTATSATVGVIGDTLWVDADRQGDIDAGETRLPGVTVSLIKDTNGDGVWDANGADNILGTPDDEPVIATDITDSNGQYLFNDVPAGAGQDYLVWVNDTHNVLGELKPTFDSDGTGTPNISAVQNLTAGGNLTQDFGYAPASHDAGDGIIGDTVFLDMNNNGVPDPGEGMEGVIVRLYNSSGAVIAATVTNENGQYFFGNLPAGTYVVQVQTASMPAGLTNTVDPDGGNNSSSTVVLAAGGINLNQDFGYRDTSSPNTISGTIWKDTDADGTLDGGEAGRFGGVTVVLRDTNGDIVATTTTAADGSYSFTNLPDGTFTVDVTDSANVLDGWWKSNGTNPGANNNSQLDPYTVTVAGGQTNDTADFGYYRDPGAVGNFVWYDADGDGIQDAGEGGLIGVKVTLQITYPNGTVVTIVTKTDENGFYYFKNLLLDEDFDGVGTLATPGVGGGDEPAFVVKVDVPTGMAASPSLQGGDPALDSDWALNGVQVFPLQGKEDWTIDFGFNPGPTGFDLASFMAISPNGGPVLVEWITLSELDTVGFYLYRSTSEDGVRELVTPGMVLARGAGSFYQFIDETAVPGQTYYYWLHMVVAPDNTEVELDIQPAMTTSGSRILLPIIIR